MNACAADQGQQQQKLVRVHALSSPWQQRDVAGIPRWRHVMTSSGESPGDVTSLAEIHLSQPHPRAADAANNSGQTMTSDDGRSLLVESLDSSAASNDNIGRWEPRRCPQQCDFCFFLFSFSFRNFYFYSSSCVSVFVITVRAVATDCVVFVGVFFLSLWPR